MHERQPGAPRRLVRVSLPHVNVWFRDSRGSRGFAGPRLAASAWTSKRRTRSVDVEGLESIWSNRGGVAGL